MAGWRQFWGFLVRLQPWQASKRDQQARGWDDVSAEGYTLTHGIVFLLLFTKTNLSTVTNSPRPKRVLPFPLGVHSSRGGVILGVRQSLPVWAGEPSESNQPHAVVWSSPLAVPIALTYLC